MSLQDGSCEGSHSATGGIVYLAMNHSETRHVSFNVWLINFVTKLPNTICFTVVVTLHWKIRL